MPQGSKPQTLVTIENLVFGTRGQFRVTETAEKIARTIYNIFHLPDSQGSDAPGPAYCDGKPCAIWIAIGKNRVLVRYHAHGDQTAAEQLLLNHAHITEDGRIGGHV